MPSDSDLLNDITKITNAIQQHRQAQQYQQQQRPRPLPYQYNSTVRPGYPNGHYNTTRGRGRGNLTLRPSAPSRQYHRPTTEGFNTSTYRPSSTYNKSLVRNTSTPPPPPSTSYRPPSTTFHNMTLNNTASPTIAKKHAGPHQSLVLNNNKVVLARPGRNKKLVIRQSGTKTDRIKRYQNSNGQQVVEIDGVPFINMGKKLVRQGQGVSSIPRVLIRRVVKRRDKNQNMVLGKRRRVGNGHAVYRREPEGYERQGAQGKTLVRKNTSTRQRQVGDKKSTYCGIFTRYGTCPKRTRCPFLHDLKHVAICLRSLVSNKCNQGTRCPLSHEPTPHNTPHCRHFQRIKCSNDACPFAHVRVRPDAPLCRAFGVEGYCPKGLTCKDLHVIVCPNFAVLGKCTKPGCQLPHVSPTSSYKPKASSTTTSTSTATSTTTSGDKKVDFGKKQWVRPGLEDAFEQQRQKDKGRRNHPQEAPSHDDDTKGHEDGFVSLFGDDDDDEDADWNQYIIKNPEDVEEIKSLRFSDEPADDDNSGDDQDDDDNDDDQEGDDDGDDFVYEAVSDDNMDHDDDSSVEEIYEEVSDMDEE